MDSDIGPIIQGWNSTQTISAPENQGCRWDVKLQVRLDLGLLQMEEEGDPTDRDLLVKSLCWIITKRN